jgi:hypothetical protein
MLIGNVIEVRFVPGCRSIPSSVKFRLAAKLFSGDAEKTYLENLLTNNKSTIHAPSSKWGAVI